VQDPDGYLLRFAENLGERPARNRSPVFVGNENGGDRSRAGSGIGGDGLGVVFFSLADFGYDPRRGLIRRAPGAA
jgi:hypothetical protein